MGEGETKTEVSTGNKKTIPLEHLKPSSGASNRVLSETDKKYFDGSFHVGIAVEVSADGKLAKVMIPDAKGVKSGADPVYITAPVRLKGAKLKAFLEKKGVDFETSPGKELGALLSDLSIGCEALYVTMAPKGELTAEQAATWNTNNPDAVPQVAKGDIIEPGPFLMMFEARLEKGLIGTLSGDDDLGDLFDVNALTIRVLRCPAGRAGELISYVNSLPDG